MSTARTERGYEPARLGSSMLIHSSPREQKIKKKEDEEVDVKALPTLEGRLPAERLLSLYRQLGWADYRDGLSVVDSSKVRLSERDFEEFLDQEAEHAATLPEARKLSKSDTYIAIAFLWMNYGPGTAANVKPGTVQLLPGWM